MALIDCDPLEEVMADLAKGQTVILDREKTGCVFQQVSAPFIKQRGGSVVGVEVLPHRDGKSGIEGMKLTVSIRAGMVYDVSFVAQNAEEPGKLQTNNLEVTRGLPFGRRMVKDIASEMLSDPNGNLEAQVKFPKNSLHIDINRERTQIRLRGNTNKPLT